MVAFRAGPTMLNPKCFNVTNVSLTPEYVESGGTEKTFPECDTSVRGQIEKFKFFLENVNFTSVPVQINPIAMETSRRLEKPNISIIYWLFVCLEDICLS